MNLPTETGNLFATFDNNLIEYFIWSPSFQVEMYIHCGNRATILDTQYELLARKVPAYLHEMFQHQIYLLEDSGLFPLHKNYLLKDT